MIDIFGAASGREISVAWPATSTRSSMPHGKQFPRGSQVVVRGQIQTMRSSYIGLLTGLAFSLVSYTC
jgi:hypothetical protein